jgi:hypothetical protein
MKKFLLIKNFFSHSEKKISKNLFLLFFIFHKLSISTNGLKKPFVNIFISLIFLNNSIKIKDIFHSLFLFILDNSEFSLNLEKIFS